MSRETSQWLNTMALVGLGVPSLVHLNPNQERLMNEYEQTLQVGDLAYYVAIRSGLVPVAIQSIDGRNITVKATAERYAYPRGYVWTVRDTFIIKRARGTN